MARAGVFFNIAGNFDPKAFDDVIKKLDQVKRETENAAKAGAPLSRIGDSFKAAGTKISGFGKTLTTNVTLPLAAVGAAAYSAIQAGSDLAETTSKVGVIFGQSAGEIEKFASTAAESLGQSKIEAMNAASTFAVFGKSAGISGDELVRFSTDFTSLASDLASFNNTTPEEAITAIGAALRGENEPIRRYGVLLDDASLRQEALRQGLIQTTKQALTPQQKVLAASALIYKQTGDAQGDFARTSEGLANQQRILKAQFENTRAELGTQLMPIALQFAGVLRDSVIPFVQGVVEKFQALSPETKDFIVKAGLMVAAIGPLLVVVGKLTTGIGATIKGVGSLVTVTAKGTKSLIAFGTGFAQPASGASAFASTAQVAGAKVRAAIASMAAGIKTAMLTIGRALMANPWILIVAAIVAAVVVIVKNWDTIKAAFLKGWEFIKSIGGKIVDFFKAWVKLYADIGKFIVEGLWNGIKNAGSWLLDQIKGWASGILDGIKGFFGIGSPSKKTAEFGKNISEGLAVGIKEGAPGVYKATQDVSNKTLSAVSDAAKKARDRAKKAAKEAMDAAKDQISEAQALFQGVRDRILGALDDVVAKAQDRVSELAAQLSSLKDEARDFARSIADAFRSFASIAGFVIEKVDLESFQNDIASASEKVTEALDAESEAMKDLRDAQRSLAILQAKNAELKEDDLDTEADRLSLADKLIDANEKVAEATKKVAAASKSVTKAREEAVKAENALVNAQERSKVTTAKVLEDFRKRIQQSIDFMKQISELRNLGLNDASLTDIINAGAETGSQIAGAILQGGGSAVREINDLQALFNNEATRLGDLLAQDRFGKQIEKAQEILASAEKDLSLAQARRDAMAATFADIEKKFAAILGFGETTLDDLEQALKDVMNGKDGSIATMTSAIAKLGQVALDIATKALAAAEAAAAKAGLKVTDGGNPFTAIKKDPVVDAFKSIPDASDAHLSRMARSRSSSSQTNITLAPQITMELPANADEARLAELIDGQLRVLTREMRAL